MKTHTLKVRIGDKLFKQLTRYADKNDEGVVSRTVRRALRKLLKVK